MKIKTQLRIFMSGVILIPVLAFIIYPIFRYLNRPEKILFGGYKQVRKLSELDLSANDACVLKQALKTLPQNIEFILSENNNKIVISTIPEFQESQEVSLEEFYNYMNSTNEEYFYQFVRPPLKDKSKHFLLISRVPRESSVKKQNAWEKILYKLLIFSAIFELFCITIVAQLTRTITKSITILDSNTKRIAGGDFEVQLEHENNKRKANEITSLTENLDKMRLKLKDEMERRTRFIMGISHDLRTPVAVIKGYTEAMSDGMCENPDEVKKSLDIISAKTDQLENMINTLINFVKLNQTDWTSQLQKQKIAPVIREFTNTSITTGDIFKRIVTAQIDVPEDLEIAFDQPLILRALENLFSNALRYTKEGDKIEIKSYLKDGFLKISIKDHGIGIDKKDLDKIFDLFYRATNSRREEGMGIGLSVVKTIINAHGWKISVESEKDEGTDFTISVPIAAPEK